MDTRRGLQGEKPGAKANLLCMLEMDEAAVSGLNGAIGPRRTANITPDIP